MTPAEIIYHRRVRLLLAVDAAHGADAVATARNALAEQPGERP